MIRNARTRVRIACFFLVLLLTQGLMPTVAWALTSGPAQPESRKFEPAGMSDMVDLFTGDFKYNIPLLDVGGYPVNLSYQSGSGMDDEASWVGLGWSLNPGAINRQIRGIADDADGDEVITETSMKPKITSGGRLTVRGELFGNDAIKVNGSLTVGLFNDNYTGYGADFGVNAGASLSLPNLGPMSPGLGGNIGINSNTSDGVSVTPSVSLSMTYAEGSQMATSVGLSANLGYNTREGLKGLTLGGSFSALQQTIGLNLEKTYNTPPFYPKTNIAFKSTNATYSADLGATIAGVYGALGVTGYKTVREVLNPLNRAKAYGFMYAEHGSGVDNALMDFMRERENPVIPQLRNLPLPVATPDLFSYSSQFGGGQFQLYRQSSGVFFDNQTTDISDNKSLSAEFGAGGYLHGGVSIYQQDITTINGKWKNDNDFLSHGDFQKAAQIGEETAYFKEVGEKHVDDPIFAQRILGEQPVSIPLAGKKAEAQLKQGAQIPVPSPSSYKKEGRQVRRTAIMPMTALEASNAGFSKRIYWQDFNREGAFEPADCSKWTPKTSIGRLAGVRKPGHISEITVTKDDGKRMIYGIPVYNNKQEEYTFATHKVFSDANNQVNVRLKSDGKTVSSSYLVNGESSRDEFYQKETQPAYATSYLLTDVLSPDYVDVTGDGITEDDRGTAIKFNYSKLENDFHWRTPAEGLKAQYNRGLNADPEDDKGSFVYGEKELWYLHSIESKTMIAYFLIENREDALGLDWQGGTEATNRQKRLKEIRLYAKSDLSTPVKTVKFRYNYDELCLGLPNSSTLKGKLALKQVYFEYGSSKKGENHAYRFSYNKGQDYDHLSTDRWGTLKPKNNNLNDGFNDLRNDEFPYATRNKTDADKNAGMWQLSKIELPTGGIISVDYESDQYAYVQDKKAMEMEKITAMKNGENKLTNNLLEAKTFCVEIPGAPNTKDVNVFRDKCLNGDEFMYFKLFVNMTDEPESTDESKYDFVPCYGKIKSVDVENGKAWITFLDDEDHLNPFASAALQKMRTEYQRYAYPGYKNRITDDRAVPAMVNALGNAIKNLAELWENFNERARRKNFASHVNLNKSFARAVKMDGKKFGGGARVKRVRMSDEWNVMAGEDRAVYGQEYDYETKFDDGTSISNGVAAYEPSLGGDENPLRQPVKYVQGVKWGLSNRFYIEEPLAESLYPAPQVGYREVKVRALGPDEVADPDNKTGWLSYEFYTAKEYPVFFQQTALQKELHEPKSWGSFFGGKKVYELSMSQGYTIFLNDMHGKPKAERVFNRSGAEIAATEYYYASEDAGGVQRLTNVVDVVDNTGTITKDQIIGRDIDMFSDMRQSETNNNGQSINLGMDVIPFGFILLPLPHFPWSQNDDYRLFRSASVLKTVNYAGMVNKVIKKINGSSTTASYLLYDKNTGEPVLTQSENEFNDPVYTLSLPAYWMYGQMGMAYQNLGSVLEGFRVDINGVPYPEFRPFLTPGDEIVTLGTSSDQRTWVINTAANGTGAKSLKLIDRTGRIAKSQRGTVKICRSGYRNLLSASATSITSQKNPIEGNKLALLSADDLSSFRVLNANAVLYDEAWGQPVDCNIKSCPEGYEEGPDGRCYAYPDATYVNDFEIVDGSRHVDYGSWGGYFFRGENVVADHVSGDNYWRTRLNEMGVWLKDVPDGQWWGMEKCISVDLPTYILIGQSVDDEMQLFIDNVPVPFTQMVEGNFRRWHVRNWPQPLSIGKHTIKVLAKSNVDENGNQTPKAVAFEIYRDPQLANLWERPEQLIRDSRLLTSLDLKGDPNTWLYLCDAAGNKTKQNYRCANGNALNTCDGTPDCGVREKGSCPDGYKPSADGQACVPINGVTVDNDPVLTVAKGTERTTYTNMGARFYDKYDILQGMVINPYWGTDSCRPNSSRVSAIVLASGCGKLNTTGIWLNGEFGNSRVGINTCLKVPETKTYYMGVGADSRAYIYLDGALIKSIVRDGIFNPTYPYEEWKVFPVDLPAGQHVLTIEAVGSDPEHTVGVEVYDNTLAELKNTTNPSIIFTTAGMWGKPADTYIKNGEGQIIKRRYTCPSGSVDVCSGTFQCASIPNGNVLNPYVTGFLGNWLPYQQMAWLTSRSGQELVTQTTGSTNVRQNGYYKKFVAYWVYNNGWKMSTDIDWVSTTTATLYDKYSQEVESKDALNRYSAARYGYKSSLPIAVGANMRQREIFYDGFDDYRFNSACIGLLPCEPDGFSIRNILGTSYASDLVDTDAHSGNYSLKITRDFELKTHLFGKEHTPGIYLGSNKNGEYFRNVDEWLGLRGFNPVTGRKYVFSAWIKDGQASGDPQISLEIKQLAGNISKTVDLKKLAVVEGWKLVEGIIDLPGWNITAEMSEISAILRKTGENVLIDDIRIFPYDGQLKTFTYDERTMRVMAQMDENNYATFYEYDDEGLLSRVKKETERGIMTIKESRSSYRKKPQQ